MLNLMLPFPPRLSPHYHQACPRQPQLDDLACLLGKPASATPNTAVVLACKFQEPDVATPRQREADDGLREPEILDVGGDALVADVLVYDAELWQLICGV